MRGVTSATARGLRAKVMTFPGQANTRSPQPWQMSARMANAWLPPCTHSFTRAFNGSTLRSVRVRWSISNTLFGQTCTQGTVRSQRWVSMTGRSTPGACLQLDTRPRDNEAWRLTARLAN